MRASPRWFKALVCKTNHRRFESDCSLPFFFQIRRGGEMVAATDCYPDEFISCRFESCSLRQLFRANAGMITSTFNWKISFHFLSPKLFSVDCSLTGKAPHCECGWCEFKSRLSTFFLSNGGEAQRLCAWLSIKTVRVRVSSPPPKYLSAKGAKTMIENYYWEEITMKLWIINFS